MLPYKYTRQLEWNQGRRDQEPILLDHLSYLVLETENRASVEHLRNRKLQRSSRLQIASPQQILSFVFRAKSKTKKRRSEPLSSCVKVGTHSPKVRFIEKKRDIFIKNIITHSISVSDYLPVCKLLRYSIKLPSFFDKCQVWSVPITK